MLSRLGGCLLAVLLTGSVGYAQQKTTYSIVPNKSKIEINVYKEGLFKAFGHDHMVTTSEISGQVQYDSQKIENSGVELKIAASSLSVTDPGESEKDRQDVQAAMRGEKVLDVAKFAEIAFSSTGISGAKQTPEGWDITLTGNLRLHGVQKAVTFPLKVRVEGGVLRAHGEVSIAQSDYGITPVKAAGGSVTVKDKIKITFTIEAAGH
ncbi:MAG TPA: YceI family protein [Candidatus Acidoferrum sp.]|jgi:polyisoprenoid-binding protein YceI